MTTNLLTDEQTTEDLAANPAQMAVTEIPEKFKDPATGALQPEKLLQSYLALEKKLSSRGPQPPASAEEYAINCPHGLFEPDTEINERMVRKGFTQEQDQEVYDLAAEKLIPLIMEIAAEFQAEREIERLEEYFGGAEQWREMSRQLLAYGQKTLSPDMLRGMAGSNDGVIALYNMMKSESGAADTPSPRVEVKKQSDELEIQAMMRSPKYWKEKDPSTIAKVTEGFMRIYGGA